MCFLKFVVCYATTTRMICVLACAIFPELARGQNHRERKRQIICALKLWIIFVGYGLHKVC